METVILLIQHDMKEALGLIINRPADIRLSEAFPDVKELQQKAEHLFIGGPVAINQMFLLLRSVSPVEEAEHVFGCMSVHT